MQRRQKTGIRVCLLIHTLIQRPDLRTKVLFLEALNVKRCPDERKKYAEDPARRWIKVLWRDPNVRFKHAKWAQICDKVDRMDERSLYGT
jgi:hypothetical protein